MDESALAWSPSEGYLQRSIPGKLSQSNAAAIVPSNLHVQVATCTKSCQTRMKLGRTIGDFAVKLPGVGAFARNVQDRARRYRRRGPHRHRSAAPAPKGLAAALMQALPGGAHEVPTVAEWLENRWSAVHPLDFFPIPTTGPRLSIVTDSVGSASLFGGVGTALVLSALLANRMGATLRLITRDDPPDAYAVGRVLAANGVILETPLEAVFAPAKSGRELPISDDDFFLSTSWWTTRALLSSVRRDRLAYLLQEDERMFYPHGDERVCCRQTMYEPGLMIVVNSELLFDHLADGPEAIPDLAERGHWFEPAFPAAGRTLASPEANGRRKFFFYARPNNLRNLFATGLEAISHAIAAGTLHPAEWDIHLVGKDVPDLLFPRGVRPRRVEGLNWNDYHDLVASMDAGLVLMDTPHPSYPPLDLAAHGAAVLTNAHGLKTDLSCYSRNILLEQPDMPSLARGITRLVALARDPATRSANLRADHICRDWKVALAAVVERLADRFTAEAREPGHASIRLSRSA